jgi:phosphatidylglycerophosphate synthase
MANTYMNNIKDNTKMNRMIYNKSILSGKIHGSLEDPLSQIFYDISDVISPSLQSIDITPNFITTVRFLMMICAFPYLFYNKMYNTAAIVYIIAYFFDCLDGHMARKYNMDTDLGDYYDHIVDMISYIVSLSFITLTLNKNNKWIIFLIIYVTMISIIQLGCQERYLKLTETNKNSKAMSLVSCMCSEFMINDDDIEKTMEYTKLFGIGTLQIFITTLIWNFKYLE